MGGSGGGHRGDTIDALERIWSYRERVRDNEANMSVCESK